MRSGSWRVWCALPAVVAALAGAAAAAAASSPALQPVVLPRDHGAHPAFQIEWWYTAGTVADQHDRDYFWFATVWSGMGFLVARVNVVDLGSDRIVLSQENVSTSPPSTGQTTIDVDGFDLRGQPHGAWSIDAPVSATGRLQLSLTPAQPYVLNGPAGIVREGRGAASAYYSDPRLAARGKLVLDGRASRLRGQGWFDHQWGNFATNSASWHWNWFACQLRGGSDLMLYQFINPAGTPTGVQDGTFVSARGVVSHLRVFTVVPQGPVIQPHGATGRYPLRWRLTVPSAHLKITLRARARNQFIANHYLPGFWEGVAAISSGAQGGCIVESTRESMTSF